MKFRRLFRAPLANLYDYPNYQNVLNSITLNKNDRILDLGCGTGIMEYLLYDDVAEIVGIDISQPVINYLNQNFKKGHAHFLCINILSETANGDITTGFDKILCIDVLEHVQSPENLLFKVCSLLKSGGEALVTFPVNNYHHGIPILEEQISQWVKNLPCPASIKYYVSHRFFLNTLYTKVRRLFPIREGDSFDNTFSFDLLQKQKSNILYRFAYNIAKGIIILLASFIGNTFHEVKTNGTRCNLSMVKS